MTTSLQKKLLEKLASGALDGQVGDDLITSGKSTVWMTIINGIPQRLKEGPGGRYFDNRTNVHFSGKKSILQIWQTDTEKLDFLGKFGWLMKDKDVQEYSKLFKPKK